MVTIEELERRDNNESFEKMEKEAEEKERGAANSLLTKKICEGVAKRLTEDAMKTFLGCETCSCGYVCDRQQVLDIARRSQKIEKPFMSRKKQRKIGSKRETHYVAEVVSHPLPEMPDMPEEFRRSIEKLKGKEILFVVEKELMKTDLEKNNNRLSIPNNQIKNEFLKAEEYTKVGEEGIEVLLIQPSLMQSRHQLKKWTMKNNFYYNLINGWYKQVVANLANGLYTGCTIRLWSFRIENQLCFAMIKP